jgi:hypothetical protein
MECDILGLLLFACIQMGDLLIFGGEVVLFKTTPIVAVLNWDVHKYWQTDFSFPVPLCRCVGT